MGILSLQQILTVAGFLGILGLAWLAARHLRPGALPGTGRRMRVTEVLALSPTDRALILQVDGADYLVLRQRGASPVVTPLPGVQP